MTKAVRPGAETQAADELGADATAAPGAPDSHIASPRYVWYVIILLAVVNVFNYIDRMALSVLLPAIKLDLQLTDAQLGLLIGLAFSLFYAICGIPIARWADRGVRRNIIALALTTWSVMTALSGAAQNFWHLFLARVGIGAGEAGCLPPAQSILCDYVPLKRRAGVFAINTFGIYAGTMLSMVLAGWLGETIGWRWTFVALGLPGVALALLIRLTLREPPRGAFDTAKDDGVKRSFAEVLKILYRCRTYRFLILLYGANGFLQYGLNQWWPSFFSRSFGLSLSSIGVYLGISLGLASGLGLLLGGLLANILVKKNVKLPLLMGAVSTMLVLPVALGSLFAPTVFGAVSLVALTGFFWSVSNGPVIASAQSVVAPQMRATATAVIIFFTSVLGFGLGPFCVGLLSDFLAPSLGIESLRYAMLLPIGLVPVMVLGLYLGAHALPQDLAARGEKY